MTRRVWLGALVVLLALVAAVPPAVSGGQNKRFSIALHETFTSPSTAVGTFSAAGVVNDSGTLLSTFTAVPGKNDTRRADGTFIFTGGLGTLTIDFSVISYTASNPRRINEGVFEIVSGSGAYPALTGGGKSVGVIDLTTSPGSATLVLDGKAG